jgi:hypothetical protein
MRDGFHEIVSGWMIIDDFDDLTERIERAAEWTEANGPLQPDEEATVKLMIESQIARGIRRGDFEPYISSDTDPGFLRNDKDVTNG